MQQPNKNDTPEALWQGYEGYIERALYMSDDISSLIMHRLLFILFLYSLRIIEDLQNRVADDLYHDDAIILIP